MCSVNEVFEVMWYESSAIGLLGASLIELIDKYRVGNQGIYLAMVFPDNWVSSKEICRSIVNGAPCTGNLPSIFYPELLGS